MYIGMLYSLCILQGYKMSLILNITPKVISEKKSCEIKLDFKNHRDKLWNTTGLIRFLVYFTTWQTSYPSPLPQKTSCENEARDKDSSLMQFRGKGKARNFFGKPSQPQSSVGLPCFMDSILLPGKAGVQREISALLCSALQPPERMEVIYCFPLLLLAAFSNWSSTPPSSVLGGWDWLIQPLLKR